MACAAREPFSPGLLRHASDSSKETDSGSKINTTVLYLLCCSCCTHLQAMHSAMPGFARHPFLSDCLHRTDAYRFTSECN